MNTRDFILVGAGVVVGFFVKRTLDNRNALALADNSLPADTNYVFSQKYKNCEASVTQDMAQSKYAGNVDLVAMKKSLIDDCMKVV